MNSIRKLEMSRRYEEGLKLCKHWGNDFAVIKNYITSIFDQNLLGIRTRLQERERFSVCDLGAGEGTITEHLLSILLDQAPKSTIIAIDLVEPEQAAAEALMNRLKIFSSHANLRQRLQKMSAEQFLNEKKPTSSYDLVFASHSFYFINMSFMPTVVASVRLGGYLCTILGAESSWMSYFKDFFSKQPSAHGGTFRKAFAGCAREGDWTTDHQGIGTRLNLGEMRWPSPDDIDETSRNMMSLVLQKDFDSLSGEERSRVHREMSPHLKKGHMILDGDYILSRRDH